MRLSVTTRIALLSFLLALVSNLTLVGFVWRQSQDDAIVAMRRETIEQSDALHSVWRAGGLHALIAAIDDARTPGDVSLDVAVIDRQGRRIAGYGPELFAVPLATTRFRIAMLGTTGGWAKREAGYSLRPVGVNWLLAGRNLDLIEAQQHALEQALLVAVVVSLALGVAAGLVLARYVGRRLDGIGAAIEAAVDGDFSKRVKLIAGGDDSFDRLAGRLNAMLGKIERLMAELRLVTNSLAHDLRSPLARLRTKTEQAVLIADPAQRETALGGLLVETDLVMRMLTMVIEISRSESVSRDRFIRVAPAEVVEEVAELYEPVAEEAGLYFQVVVEDRPAPMAIHRELLSQAVANLIDNALRHGASGGAVTLRVSQRSDGVAIQVEDRGPGIAEADRAHALSRFGRLDSARSTPGAGLGMALIEAVARLHGGRFELANNAPGLIARIVLPT